MNKPPLLVCIVLLASVALAEQPADAPAEKPAAPAKPLPDLCRDAVDPYNAPGERGRFFAAAGKDSELTAAEAEANRKAPKPFVRRFDRWSSMIAFDKNANKTLDWFEADAYRKGFRQRVLLVFDADKNSRLADKERELANRALAAGKLPRAKVGEADRPPIWVPAPSRPGQDEGRGELTPQRLLERYDTDGDGKLSDEERQAMRDQWGKRMEEWRQGRELRRYDKNKDGKLDEDELAEQEKGQAEREKRAAEWRARAEERRKEWTAEWDADGDGELSEEERQAMRDSMGKRIEEIGGDVMDIAADWRQQWDADGDGKLSPDERQAIGREIRQRVEKVRSEVDADGDGQISPEEGEAFRQKFVEKYDADGDGKLNDEERAAMIRAELRRFFNPEPDTPADAP